MAERVEAEVKELEKLEQAAEETNAPEEIQQRAAQPEAAAAPKGSRFWFGPYLILLAILGGAIFLLDWQRSFFRPDTAAKIHRYLLGGIGIAVVLAVARAIEVYAINRLRNAVARFNLRRVLRLVVTLAVAFRSPFSCSNPRKLSRSRRRGSGASDRTKSATSGSSSTLVFIKD